MTRPYDKEIKITEQLGNDGKVPFVNETIKVRLSLARLHTKRQVLIRV